MFSKLKFFWALDLKTKLMLIEAFCFLGYARFLKTIPFSRVAKTLGEEMKETSFALDGAKANEIKKVGQSIGIMSKYVFWESKCLVKAIAALKMLERRKIESTLYLGTGKNPKGEFAAHAWLRSGPFFVTGANGMEKYTVVGTFAKRTTHGHLKGAEYGERQPSKS
jgi:hypothetical protein